MRDILSVFVRNVMLVGYWINTGLRKSPKAFCFNNCLSHWGLVTHIRVCELGHQWFRHAVVSVAAKPLPETMMTLGWFWEGIVHFPGPVTNWYDPEYQTFNFVPNWLGIIVIFVFVIAWSFAVITYTIYMRVLVPLFYVFRVLTPRRWLVTF